MQHIIHSLAATSIPLCIIAGILYYQLRRAERQASEREEAYNTMRSKRDFWAVKCTAKEDALAEAKQQEVNWRFICNEFEKDLSDAKARLAKYDRPRDPKTGRIVSRTQAIDLAVSGTSKTAETMQNVTKLHQLRHGMTVKDPTEQEVNEIFEAAEKAGIRSANKVPVNAKYPCIWYYVGSGEFDGVSACGTYPSDEDIYIPASEFLSRIRGEWT